MLYMDFYIRKEQMFLRNIFVFKRRTPKIKKTSKIMEHTMTHLSFLSMLQPDWKMLLKIYNF